MKRLSKVSTWHQKCHACNRTFLVTDDATAYFTIALYIASTSVYNDATAYFTMALYIAPTSVSTWDRTPSQIINLLITVAACLSCTVRPASYRCHATIVSIFDTVFAPPYVCGDCQRWLCTVVASTCSTSCVRWLSPPSATRSLMTSYHGPTQLAAFRGLRRVCIC